MDYKLKKNLRCKRESKRLLFLAVIRVDSFISGSDWDPDLWKKKKTKFWKKKKIWYSNTKIWYISFNTAHHLIT